MRNINNLIKRYANLMDEKVENIISKEYLGNASFYMADNCYINSECDCGVRGSDHRSMFGATKMNYYETKNAWKKLQCNYNLIRVIPEYPCIMIHKSQTINTWQQKEITKLVKEYGYTIEYYTN